MATVTMEARLAEIGRRIDGLYAHAQAGVGEAALRTQRHVDALWQKEASARAAVREAYAESRQAVSDYAAVVDYKLKLLEIELEIAEASVAADRADNANAFGDAVDAELGGWDVYLERLQVRAATKVGSARTQAEDAIRDLRRRRNALARGAAEVRTASDEAWHELKTGVDATRGELERAIDEASTTFD